MTTTGKVYGGAFDAQNHNNPRTIIGHWVPTDVAVLEVGPGDGVISRWLKEVKHCRTIGVEVVPEAVERMRTAFDHIIVGSIETESVVAQARVYAPYDAIIFADVLEHLVDPWSVLRQMRPLLSSTGRVLVSVPNVAHLTARLNLLFGYFEYTDGYLMDRTHLRWFTHRSAKAMAHTTGYRVMAEATVYKPRLARFWPTLNGFQIVLNLAPA